MPITKLFDSADCPFQHIHHSIEFAVRERETAELLSLTRGKVVRACAELIAAEDKYFSTQIKNGYGRTCVDVVVMTHDELAELMRKQFRAGIDHAQGFRGMDSFDIVPVKQKGTKP
jgi:hypothetical protein